MKTIEFKNDYKLVKSNKIDTITFIFFFPIEWNIENSYYIKILDNLLCTSNIFFQDREEFKKETLRKSLLSLDLSSYNYGKSQLIKYQFEIPRENLIKDYNIEESFKLAIDCLINPNVKDNQFDNKEFLYEKDYFIKRFKNANSNIESSNSRKLWDIIDKYEKTRLLSDKALNKLNDLTSKDVYEFYLKNILNNKPFIYVFGNIEENILDKLFNKYYPLTKDIIEYKKDYINIIPKLENKAINIDTEFNQFDLNVIYQIEVNEDNYYLLNIINDFLSLRENNLIFKSLRTNNNLVYVSGTEVFARFGILEIYAYTQEHNIDKCIQEIDKVMDLLKDEKIVLECLNKTKKYIKYDLLREQDSYFKEINNLIDTELELLTLEEMISKYNNITVKEIIEFVNKLEKTSIIIFRGKKYENEH